jgi:hypothetical protein
MKYLQMYLVNLMWGCSILLSNCTPPSNTFKSKIGSQTIKALLIKSLFPKLTPEGKLTGYDTLIGKVFETGDYHLFQSSFNRLTFSKNGEIKSSHREFTTFVFAKGNKFGSLYNYSEIAPFLKVPVDSMLQEDWAAKKNIGRFITENKSSLYKKQYDSISNTLVEIYDIDSSTNSAKTRLTLYFSKKLNGFEYSLGKELDNIKGMKLFNAVLEVGRQYAKQYNTWIDAMILKTWIEELTEFDEMEIQNYLDKEN